MRRAAETFSSRAALVVALCAAWLNFLLTAKWALYPAEGDSVVALEYPRRVWLSVLALLALAGGGAIVNRICATPSSRSAAA